MEEKQGPVFNKSDRPYHNRIVKDAPSTPQAPATTKSETNPLEDMTFRDGIPRYVSSPLGETAQAVQFDGKVYFDAGRRADLRHRGTGTDYKGVLLFRSRSIGLNKVARSSRRCQMT
jgi:hypothetical protein